MPQQEASREFNRNPTYKLWVDQRVEVLLEMVSAHDVLRHFGVELKYSGDTHEEQICCPFHGDSNPSARLHPQEGSSRSGLYCFVCRKRWDIFALWREFNSDSEMKFTAILRGLEKAFGITTPEAPDMSREPIQRGPTEEELVVLRLLDACENRLRNNKSAFTLEGFLKVGKVLDQLHYQVNSRLISLDEAEGRCRQVLAKISEKIRSA
jgi:hypothetical protein